MTKVNKKFIEAMQKRLDEKEKIFTEKLNYKNMDLVYLRDNLIKAAINVDEGYVHEDDEKFKKELVDLANFCWMLWERLEEK